MSFVTLKISPHTVPDCMDYAESPEDTSSEEESGVAVAPPPPPQPPTSSSDVGIHSSPVFREMLDQLVSDIRQDMLAQRAEGQRRRASAPIPRILPEEKGVSESGHRDMSGARRRHRWAESQIRTGNTGKERYDHRDLLGTINRRDTPCEIPSGRGGARRRTWPLRPPDRHKLAEEWVDLTDGGAGDGSDTLGENRRERANHIRHMSVHSRVVRGVPARLPLAAVTRSDDDADVNK
jgi:hypothetical protein